MSTVSAVNSATQTSDTAAKTAAGNMDYNAFLKLLIAQLKNQDPTKPMDSTEFVAQLATFSQVEQSINANSKLDSLLTSSALSLADSVIGHTVTAADGATSGVVASVRITSEGPVATLVGGDEVSLGSGISIS
ncbi:flagellar hook assembly protein FlgD [soil metagenome]